MTDGRQQTDAIS